MVSIVVWRARGQSVVWARPPRLPHEADVASLAPGSTAVGFVLRTAERHKVKIGLNFLGLFLLFFVNGFTPSDSAWNAYEAKVPSGNMLRQLADAEEAVAFAYQTYYASKGWFTCDEVCTANLAYHDAKKAEFEALHAEYVEKEREANKELGLFSTHAVSSAKSMFWSRFASGRRFAKQATIWDAVFVGMRSMGRDDGIVAWIAEMIFRFLLNLVIGTLGGVVSFLFSVWSVIVSYKPDFASALLFFGACVLVAVSFFVSFVVALGATTTAVMYGAGTIAKAMLQDANRAPPQRINHRSD